MSLNFLDFCRNISIYRSEPTLRSELSDSLMYLGLPRDETYHLIDKSSDSQLTETVAHALALRSSTSKSDN